MSGRRARTAGTPALLRAVAGYGIAQRRRCARRRTCAAGPGTATTAGPAARDAGVSRTGRRAEPRQRPCSCVAGITGAAFTLILDRLEHWRKPGVLCLTTSAVPAPLHRWSSSFAPRSPRSAYRAESRPYRPHLTLARKLARFEGPAEVEPLPWRAASITLVESRSHREGSRYEPLASWPLDAER